MIHTDGIETDRPGTEGIEGALGKDEAQEAQHLNIWETLWWIKAYGIAEDHSGEGFYTFCVLAKKPEEAIALVREYFDKDANFIKIDEMEMLSSEGIWRVKGPA